MNAHDVGTREEFEAASAALLEREKELTRMSDQLARERRALPWVPVEKAYELQTSAGPKSLAELFDARSQLLVYHFMFGPDWDEGCVGCSFLADHVDGAIAHVQARDATMVFVSRAPLEKLLAYKERMGWGFEWVSSLGSDFNHDFGMSDDDGEGAGLSAFALQDGVVHHTYFSGDRGLEIFDAAYHLLDRTPLGRQEDDLPYPSAWWRRHDEYERAPAA